jgi:hypothetical protein
MQTEVTRPQNFTSLQNHHFAKKLLMYLRWKSYAWKDSHTYEAVTRRNPWQKVLYAHNRAYLTYSVNFLLSTLYLNFSRDKHTYWLTDSHYMPFTAQSHKPNKV